MPRRAAAGRRTCSSRAKLNGSSRRDRVPTTGGARPMPTDPPAAKQRASKKSESPGLTPDEFARALRAIAGELERDPSLAKRVTEAMRAGTPASANASNAPASEPPAKKSSRTFRPRVIEGARPDLGPGILDPF